MPSVSVIVPAYNAESTLATAVKSLLAQGHDDLQVVVVDDGSVDGTPAVLERFPMVTSDRIPNGGTAAARNRALDLATGDVVGFLDADDAWAPGRLASVLAVLEDPTVDAVTTDYVSWDGERTTATGAEECGRKHRLDQRQRVTARLPFMFGTLVARRDLLERVGRFDRRYRVHEDTDFWYRVLATGARVEYLPEPSYLYRREGGKSGSWRRAGPDMIRINLAHALQPSTPWDLRVATARRFAYISARYALARLRREP